MFDWEKNKNLKKDKGIRAPAVAGSFYPAQKEVLEQQLDRFFQKTKKLKLDGKPKILIAPHAGIIYSGQTAAWAFKQIADGAYRRVILLGASHFHWFSHIAVDQSDLWQTPLGEVVVDHDFIEKIVDGEKIISDKKPFIKEHCLELELIFLQKVLKNFKIVPILVSDLSKATAAFLAEKISKNFDEQTLLVVSSDLSHYPPADLARLADRETIKGILSGKIEMFEKAVAEVETAGYFGLETAACGQRAISVALLVGEKLSIKFSQIHYSTSADSSGDPAAVVGYVAIVGASQKQISQGKKFLNEKEEKIALKIARETLESYLKKGVIPQFKIKEKGLLLPLGCFVTLRKKGDLRGCIGCFDPNQPLAKTIGKMAIESATGDPRFSPVQPEELDEIKIEISIIGKKRPISDWHQIKLGEEGVVIEGYGRAGTFLPDVALETGWSLEEFLSHLCFEKAGLSFDCYRDKNVRIFVFDVQKIEEE